MGIIVGESKAIMSANFGKRKPFYSPDLVVQDSVGLGTRSQHLGQFADYHWKDMEADLYWQQNAQLRSLVGNFFLDVHLKLLFPWTSSWGRGVPRQGKEKRFQP